MPGFIIDSPVPRTCLRHSKNRHWMEGKGRKEGGKEGMDAWVDGGMDGRTDG